MNIPLLDLQAQYETLRSEVEPAVLELLASQQMILGPAVGRFESEVAAYADVPHAIGCASGSDALLLALMALDIGPEDAVVTTPFTFFATAGAIVRLGAKMVLADIDPNTYNLDPASTAAALERAARDARRVVLMPVHLYGRFAPMDELMAAAAKVGAPVVEDTAQAFGARDGGRLAGTVGDIGAFSFFPSKNLGGAGDGGIMLCRDDELARRLKMLHLHGSDRRYEHDLVGINSRLDALQAVILSIKLRRIDEWNAGRRDRAALYTRLFTERGLAGGPLTVPPAAGAEHVFHQYVIRAERRDALRDALGEAGVATQVYYPVPLHRQPCFADVAAAFGELPESDRAAEEVLALPIYPELRDEQVEYVVDAIAQFYA